MKCGWVAETKGTTTHHGEEYVQLLEVPGNYNISVATSLISLAVQIKKRTSLNAYDKKRINDFVKTIGDYSEYYSAK